MPDSLGLLAPIVQCRHSLSMGVEARWPRVPSRHRIPPVQFPYLQLASPPLARASFHPVSASSALFKACSRDVYASVALLPNSLGFTFAKRRSPGVKMGVQVIFSVCQKSILLVSCHPGVEVTSWCPQLPHLEP